MDDMDDDRQIDPAISERLRILIRDLGGNSAAASAAGVSLAQIKRYLNGSSSPTFIAICRLAKVAGRSLDWIGFGTEGRISAPSIDEAHLASIITDLESALKRTGKTLLPADKARAIILIYEMERDTKTQEQRERHLRLVAGCFSA